jgi:hypothetical protein
MAKVGLELRMALRGGLDAGLSGPKGNSSAKQEIHTFTVDKEMAKVGLELIFTEIFPLLIF